ncbi:glycerol-3-phosphate phosphatase isoform X1 [Arapaima gigas]
MVEPASRYVIILKRDLSLAPVEKRGCSAEGHRVRILTVVHSDGALASYTHTMAVSKCRRLSGAALRELLDSVESVLFDCDGVIWRGESAIAGAADAVNLLKECGKRVLFLTNNSTKTRAMYVDKLRRLGFRAAEEDVFGTAFCAAVFLQAEARLHGKVYLIGSGAMQQELRNVGIEPVGMGPDPVSGGQTDWAEVALDPEVRAVLVGFDEHFSYMKLNRALQYLKDPKCLFVGTNTDSRLPLEDGKAVPGTGCLLKAVETAAQRQALIVGKPSKFMFNCAARRYGLDPAKTLMVGDRLDTDILLGSNCGLKTLLTLTGVSTLAEAKEHQQSGCPMRLGMVPDYIVESVAELLPALQG